MFGRDRLFGCLFTLVAVGVDEVVELDLDEVAG